MTFTREQIDGLTDGELFAVVEAATGFTFCAQGADGMPFAVMEAAGRRGWEMTFIHRAAFGAESLAAVAFGFHASAVIAVRHARPEIAIYRAFLYAVHTPPAER